MARPYRTALYANDPTFLWKAILRALAIILAIVGIATIGWALNDRMLAANDVDYSDNDTGYSMDYFEDFSTLPWSFITLGLSVIWNIVNLAVLFSRNKSIHPGANVGCDLVLWLGLLVTGPAAVVGLLSYFDFYPGQYDNGDNPDDSYGSFSNSTGTWSTLPNGSLVNETVAQSCGGFDTCAQLNQFESALQHKGIVIAVGVAMSFIVLLFHFALFISACRYTHARRYGVGSKYAKAITTEATKIANKMVADITGPNGTFRPRSRQQQQQPESRPLMASDPEMLQSSQAPEPGSIQQHAPAASSGSASKLPQRHYSPVKKSSNAAANKSPPQIVLNSPSPEDMHPALRREISRDDTSPV